MFTLSFHSSDEDFPGSSKCFGFDLSVLSEHHGHIVSIFSELQETSPASVTVCIDYVNIMFI